MILKGFAPISDNRAKILILGSMPSVKSLEQGQYYGHPRNAFWKIMATITGVSAEADYLQRCQAIKDRGIALWDVIGECIRPGSLDSDIDINSIKANALLPFKEEHPSLEIIALNGGTAYKLFKQHFLLAIPAHIKIVKLPSTSPAYTISIEDKIKQWHDLLY